MSMLKRAYIKSIGNIVTLKLQTNIKHTCHQSKRCTFHLNRMCSKRLSEGLSVFDAYLCDKK